ncbi:MAG: hypothetical protein GY869_02605, partial [Planctomycetes bacterium]|nr:hypothetical protein [Planctomycetota bacterium]
MSSSNPTSFIAKIQGMIKRLLLNRKLPFIIVSLAIVLSLSSLKVGWLWDDYIHRSIILQEGGFSKYSDAPLDIFRFMDGDPQRTSAMMDDGMLPWWTYRELKAAFWRPVTSVTHWLDYQYWPTKPVMM